MTAHEVIAQRITTKIEYDLKKTEDFERDPLGNSFYLFFALKNGLRSSEIEYLIDWMNLWVDSVINQRKFTRFVDKEFTSAVFSYFSLKKFRRLRAKVKSEGLEELVSKHVKDDRFFRSFTLSAIVLIALSDMKDEIESYSRVLKWIESEVENGAAFKDAKNLVLASILFEMQGAEVYLKRIVEFCWRKLSDNDIPYSDELFYAWVLWTYRNRLEKKELPTIRNFSDTTIENASRLLEEEPQNAFIIEHYGSDIKAPMRDFNLSKIYLGIYLDLLTDFTKKTIRVAREEWQRKDISPWIRMSSLISGILLFSDVSITWLSFQFKLVNKIPISEITSNSLPQFLINLFLFLSVVIIGLVAISMLWDTGYKGIVDTKTVNNNLKHRLSNRVVDGIIIALVLIPLLSSMFGM